MQSWWMKGEVELDDLLADEVMASVVRSAGMSRADFRRQLADTARRLKRRREGGKSGYRAAFWELRAIR